MKSCCSRILGNRTTDIEKFCSGVENKKEILKHVYRVLFDIPTSGNRDEQKVNCALVAMNNFALSTMMLCARCNAVIWKVISIDGSSTAAKYFCFFFQFAAVGLCPCLFLKVGT